jgi:hypothetical protein
MAAPKQVQSGDTFITATRAGAILGLAGSSVTALARKGQIPFQFDGSNRIRLYRIADVEKFKREREARK